MQSVTDKIASTHLGKKSEGSEKYDSSLLVCVPRRENRERYGIYDGNLPFEGLDIWHAYEFSTLCENGLPVTRLLKLKYNCRSKFIIESKSFKLYLNSFNMSRFGKNPDDCLKICKNIIEKDLSEKLETLVEAYFLNNNAERIFIFNDFENLTDFVDSDNLQIEHFKESPQVLKIEEKPSEYRLAFESLRSNCRVTHQPDFGDVFIYYKSKKHILEDGLLKYLCSFRTEFHFHEECCEMIYKRLYDLLDDGDKLMVCALYTRRGGIDICPVRSNCGVNNVLIDITKFARGSIKQ